MEFEGRKAIVTGGASGIGLSVVQRFIEGGAVVTVLDLNPDGAPSRAFVEVADVSNPVSVCTAVDVAAAKMGGIDIVVNNAGIGAVGSIEELDEHEWARVFSVNVTSIARVTGAALSYLRNSDAAAVVNISSIAASVGLQDRALYSASKGAVSALTRAMAADHLTDGVRVNSVNPGTVNTPWVTRLLESSDDPDSAGAALLNRQPHGRLVEPQEVAEAVAYLASPFSGSTTGANIAVDGGMDGLRLRAR
ncbi:MAG: SDR family oxidoreductase [Microcella sp.]|uniref:SDR family NAD(P)-dependent oxidoreductase n=1 Tax=Microcella sp. TaxID=1913979 RepID=UPI0033157598